MNGKCLMDREVGMFRPSGNMENRNANIEFPPVRIEIRGADMERRGGNIAPRGFAVENRPTDIERPRGGVGLCAGATVLPRPAMKENGGRIEARRNDMEVSGARIDARGALASPPDERLSAR